MRPKYTTLTMKIKITTILTVFIKHCEPDLGDPALYKYSVLLYITLMCTFCFDGSIKPLILYLEVIKLLAFYRWGNTLNSHYYHYK